MAVMTPAQTQAELQRKRNQGIAPTNSANLAAYNKLTPVPAQKPTGVVPPMMGKTSPAPVTPMAAQSTTTGGYVPPMNAATNTTGQAPALGYGAGGEYGKTQGLGQVYAANKALIGTDAGKQSEIARTQAVIAARQAAGEDVSLQEKYLTNQLGYVPPMPQTQPQGVAPPMPMNQLSPDQINQEASYQINKERSDLQTAADLQSGNLRDNAAYANQLLNDSRALSDVVSSQSTNPFSNMGKRTFDEGLKQRQRSIDDTYLASNLTRELDAVDKDLYNFDKLAPDKQRALVNEMTRIERDYGLQVGQLTGQIPGMGAAGQTMQSKAFDRDIFESDRDFATTLDRIKRADYESDRDYEFARTQTEWDNMFKTKQFDEGKAARLWEQAFQDKNFSQRIKDEAASRGLQWASLNQRDKEFIADQAFREKQFTYQKEQDELKAREKPPAELNVKDSTNNFNMLLDDLDDPAITKEEARRLLSDNSKFLTDADYKKFNDEINSRF